MSNFSQDNSNANINKQINITGDITIQQKENSSIIYVTAIGKEKFLPNFVKSQRKTPTQQSQKKLEVEPDFIVSIVNNLARDAKTVNDFNSILLTSSAFYNQKFSIGQKIKFNVLPGEYTIFISPNNNSAIDSILTYELKANHDFPTEVQLNWALIFTTASDQRRAGLPYPASLALPIQAGEIVNLNFNPPTINFA